MNNDARMVLLRTIASAGRMTDAEYREFVRLAKQQDAMAARLTRGDYAGGGPGPAADSNSPSPFAGGPTPSAPARDFGGGPSRPEGRSGANPGGLARFAPPGRPRRGYETANCATGQETLLGDDELVNNERIKQWEANTLPPSDSRAKRPKSSRAPPRAARDPVAGTTDKVAALLAELERVCREWNTTGNAQDADQDADHDDNLLSAVHDILGRLDDARKDGGG